MLSNFFIINSIFNIDSAEINARLNHMQQHLFKYIIVFVIFLHDQLNEI